MIDAGPDGGHMSMDTYKAVLNFIEWTGIPIIMISGGEPLQHPDALEMVVMAKNEGLKTVLLSNGTFLEDAELTEKIIALNIIVQITNDERFYPRRIPIVDHPNFCYTDKIRIVTPIGRAVTNKLDTNRSSPLCFNLRSIARRIGNFKAALMNLRMVGKMCTPSINIDGTISAGESNFCSSFGTVYDRENLAEKIFELTCNKCGLADQLDPMYKRAIGEL
jgi:MoaA/NifB/PqqE/SkfB family radical SAM enzyme